jgi:hypothetical protein
MMGGWEEEEFEEERGGEREERGILRRIYPRGDVDANLLFIWTIWQKSKTVKKRREREQFSKR